ncbi:MAG TPA: SdrD B-like domain-containing protein, partial [Tepidisphaeraceae bacterium]|nr:SdrD B-like domain-containing protein [Tepidisphaeraceae bacterium]
MRKPTNQSDCARFESLERRQMFSATLGTNLVVNGDAEATAGSSDGSAVSIAPWTSKLGKVTAVQYGSAGFPATNSIGPASRGLNFFAGGPPDPNDANANSATSEQTIDISSLAADIDAGRIRYDLSAYVGGFGSEGDEMDVSIFFGASADSTTINGNIVGPSATDRQNTTELIPKSVILPVPAGSRVAVISMQAARSVGTYDDGYADNISLVLSSTASTKTGFIAGQVFNDRNGDGMKDMTESGLAGITVFADLNNNGKLDKGEPGSHTISSGRYNISGVPKGTFTLREVVPSGSRATTTSTRSVTVQGGITTSGKNFALSQSVLIGGEAFVDNNGNGVLDTGDTGLDNVTFYLDFNN